MKKTINMFVLLCAALAFSPGLKAQSVVALHGAGGQSYFSGNNSFTDAINAANPGDTIYLPGGNFPAPSFIDKQLYIMGAGHHPEYTAATMPSIVSGNLLLKAGTNGSHFEGILFQNSISIESNAGVHNLSMNRCHFVRTLYYQSSNTTTSDNNQYTECIFSQGINADGARFLMLSNSIFYDSGSTIANLKNGTLMNSIVLANSALLYGPINSTFVNNIFKGGHLNYFSAGPSYYSHNVFLGTTQNYTTYDTVFNSMTVESADGFFVNVPENPFSYAYDYHLQAPENFTGQDGTQTGIYGGTYPFKEGSVPSNPHIVSKQIAPSTNMEGAIEVQITVTAQPE